MKKVSLTRDDLKKHSEKVYALLSQKDLVTFMGGCADWVPPTYDNVAYADTTYIRK